MCSILGVGKTQLIRSLLNMPPGGVDSFGDGTDSVHLVEGKVNGMHMVFIDTPGLHVAASKAQRNRQVEHGACMSGLHDQMMMMRM